MMRRDLLSNIQEWKIRERTASVKGLRMEWAKYGSSVQVFGIQTKLLHLNSVEQKQRQCKHCFLSGVLLGIAVNQNVRSLFSSVQFSHSVVSDSLQPHELQHARPACPSPTPGVSTQTHVHRVGDAIQPSHPLLSPFPPAPNSSQHQSLFPMSQLFA